MVDDTRGEPIEPTSDERKPSHEGFEVARKYIEFRFPRLKGAPLLEARAHVFMRTVLTITLTWIAIPAQLTCGLWSDCLKSQVFLTKSGCQY